MMAPASVTGNRENPVTETSCSNCAGVWPTEKVTSLSRPTMTSRTV